METIGGVRLRIGGRCPENCMNRRCIHGSSNADTGSARRRGVPLRD